MDYFFIGIKGAGMASLASILHDLGYKVSGSDLDNHFFTEGALKERGIEIVPFSKDNIKDHMTVIAGNAFLDDFPEVESAKANPTVTFWRYHTFLGDFARKYTSFAVAGSHGKTTTTAMLSAALAKNLATGWLIGDGNGEIHPDDRYFVLEADEYRRHFLAYHPDYAIITNADWDHPDYFKDEADYLLAYKEFAAQVKKTLAVFGDDPKNRLLELPKNVLYYGIEAGNDVIATEIEETPEQTSFSVLIHGEFFGCFRIPLVGRFLLWNALGVIAICYAAGLDAAQIQEGLLAYHGAKRRFVVEAVGESIFVDDYAHHPTEVRVTIEAARLRWPDKKIVVVFKPHRVSRLYTFADDFAKALALADEIYLCPFTAIDDAFEGIDIDITYLQERLPGSLIVDDNPKDAALLAKQAPAVFLFLSSKDIYPLAEKVKAILGK